MARHKKSTHIGAGQRFGEWLRGIREAKRLPLRAVAAAAQMDQAHLSKVELGQRMLTAAQAKAISKFYSIDSNEIEARRIAEKFRFKYANNPAAEQAISMLYEEPATYSTKR